jgi:hypothetical protein
MGMQAGHGDSGDNGVGQDRGAKMSQLHDFEGYMRPRTLITHEGRVEALKLTLNLAETWLEEMDMDPDLLDCIMEYAHGRGGRTMENICEGLGSQYQQMARE